MSSQSTSRESTQGDKQNPSNKYKLVEIRAKVLKEILKSEIPDQEDQLLSKIVQIFEEDLNSYVNVVWSDDSSHPTTVFEMFLLMLSNLPEKKKPAGKQLVQLFIKQFVEWSTERKSELEIQLTEGNLENALKYCVKDPGLKEPFITIFGFSDEDIMKRKDEMIEDFMKNRQFKEASELIIRYGLVENYTFEELVLPLILSDKWQIVDELLKTSPRFQKEFITFFDAIVGDTDEIVEAYFEPYRKQGLVMINLNRFYGKSLTVFIQKFFNGIVKQNHFDLEERRDAPRFEAYMKGKALKYFSMQRFEVGAMADEVYFEHAKNTLQESTKDVVCYFFSILWQTRIEERRIEVLFWMRFLNFPLDHPNVPYGVVRFYKNPDPRIVAEVDRIISLRTHVPETEITEQLYVFEEEQKYPITIVKNESQLEDLCTQLDSAENGTFVGYDSEFRPSHLSDSNAIRIATIQLSFNERAYLIDCVELENEKLSDKMWIRMFQSLFDSKTLRVVGFDIKHDFDCLFSIKPIRDQFKVDEIQNAVCVRGFAELLNELDSKILKSQKSCRLINLAEELVNIKMDKSEQAGNWQYRPLRKNQIVYAALDAVAVLKVFLKMVELAKEFDASLDVEKLMGESRGLAIAKKDKVKKELKIINAHPWEEIFEIVHTHRDTSKPLQNPSDLKLIMDNMLLGLGKNLRLLGVDVYIPKDVNDFWNYLHQMKHDSPVNQRLIVTVPSKSYEAVKEQYPDAQYILLQHVYSARNPWDVLTSFLDQFNLDIRKENGFAKLDS